MYGTLKRGFCRHDALADQKYLGPATTIPSYRMFDLGSYPGLVESENGNSIIGELYKVDQNCLEKLDVIEAVDEGFYRRGQIALLSPADEIPTLTYFYLMSTLEHPEITTWPPAKRI